MCESAREGVTGPAAGLPACRHCGKRAACRAHGLCWKCSQAPEVRRLYERRCVGCGLSLRHDAHGHDRCCVCRGTKGVTPGVLARVREAGRLAREVGPGPCDALQGSVRKLAALIARAEAGLPLWDGRDGRCTRRNG